MVNLLTGLALVGAAVSSAAWLVAKLKVESVKCRVNDRPQLFAHNSKLSTHTAVFLFFAAIATLSAQKTNAPLRGASVELKMENVPAAANRLCRGYGGQVALAGEELLTIILSTLYTLNFQLRNKPHGG